MGAIKEIFKKYDIRGLVGEQLNPKVVSAIGAAFVDELDLAGQSVIVGHDMRDSSLELVDAFSEGVTLRGADVISLGLCSTDESYFASGYLDKPAAMFTASHNPASYNGIKLSRAGARGISSDTGLDSIAKRAQSYLDKGIEEVSEVGYLSDHHILAEYAAALRELVDLSEIRPLKVVIDAANGMAGMTAPAVLGTAANLPKLPLEIVPLFFELDGTFPNHEANPLDEKNLADLKRAVIAHGADLGLAFDGDADRCFVIDEKGNPVTPSAVGAIVALSEIERAKKAGELEPIVLHNLLTSQAVAEFIETSGGKPIRTRVGHSLIKDQMAETAAVFGCEHSAHYYFREFYGADNGMLAAMHLIKLFGTQQEPLSEFAKRFSPYFASGEINSTVTDPSAAIERVRKAFESANFDGLDGLTISSPNEESPWWWLNVRSSNTEPLLRLNVESEDSIRVGEITKLALELIRSE